MHLALVRNCTCVLIFKVWSEVAWGGGGGGGRPQIPRQRSCQVWKGGCWPTKPRCFRCGSHRNAKCECSGWNLRHPTKWRTGKGKPSPGTAEQPCVAYESEQAHSTGTSERPPTTHSLPMQRLSLIQLGLKQKRGLPRGASQLLAEILSCRKKS